VVVHERPRIAGRAGLGQQGGQAIQQVLAVAIFMKDLAALDAENHDMLTIPGVSSRAARGMNSCYPMRMQASSYLLA
jgi:hypothetical protein